MTDNQQSFVNDIASVLNARDDINEALKTVILAQSILESGWGEKGINTRGADYNVFGLNYYNDEYTQPYGYVELETQQYSSVTGEYYTTKEFFCRFNNYEEAVQCLVHWYDRSKYLGIKSMTDTEDITAMLQGKYATAPNYADSLNNLISKYDLGSYFVEGTDADESSTDETGIDEPDVPAEGTEAPKYFIQIGAFANKENASRFVRKLRNEGIPCLCKYNGEIYRIQAGAYVTYINALVYAETLTSAGYKCFITQEIEGKEINI